MNSTAAVTINGHSPSSMNSTSDPGKQQQSPSPSAGQQQQQQQLQSSSQQQGQQSTRSPGLIVTNGSPSAATASNGVTLDSHHGQANSSQSNSTNVATATAVVASSGAIVLTSTSSDGGLKYSLAGENVLQPHEIYIKAEPIDPMPPLAAAVPFATSTLVDSSSANSASEQQLYFISSSDLVHTSLKNANHHSTLDSQAHSSPGDKQSDQSQSQQPQDLSQEQQQQQQQQQVNGGNAASSNSATCHSPQLDKQQQQQQQQQQQLTNGGGQVSTGAIVVTTPSARETSNKVTDAYSLHNSVLQPHEIYIKAEPELDPMPPIAAPANVMDTGASTGVASLTTVTSAEKIRDLEGSPPATVISLAPAQPYPRGATQLTFATPTYDISGNGQYTVQVNTAVSPPQYATVTAQNTSGQTNGQQTVYLTTDYITYRDYYSPAPVSAAGSTVQTIASSDQYQTVRQQLTAAPVTTYTSAASDTSVSVSSESTGGSFLDRYLRQPPVTTGSATVVAASGVVTYKPQQASAGSAGALHGGLTVDLPSPDSGIGEATVTPRENGQLSQIFDYTELTQAQASIIPVAPGGIDQSTSVTLSTGGPATPGSTGSNSNASTPSASAGSGSKSSRRSWHEYGRNSEVDKVQIPKIYSDVGFKYYLESPISTSQRREDDRITYINKGQFYGVTLEYIPDPDRPIKSATVKTLMLLVFREEKSHEDEIKAWQFWHSRQHSIKQRILDADTKNSSGIIGTIEELTHNSISFYWNPLEGPAKINIAVQCLSTDFSNQKGVKGLPLHLQIDTFDDIRDGAVPYNRGYCQIKVFCDKGAERKTRDEERRAAKRKITATGNGRKKIEDMYHPVCERSEFYTMADVLKPPVLFTPSEELEKQINAGEINFYTGTGSTGDLSSNAFDTTNATIAATLAPTTAAALVAMDKRHSTSSVDALSASVEMAITQPPIKRIKLYPQDRVLIYAKQENEEVFHPLHLVPPSLLGLAMAIQNKYKLEAKNIRHIYKRCRKGITVQMDDDMVKHYSNEDTCLLEVHQVDEQTHDITLVEYEAN